MVPVTIDDEGRVKEPENTKHPFMRGIMHFDDYSYSHFNQYVLLAEPHDSEKQRVIADRKTTLLAKDASAKDNESSLTQEQLDKKSYFKHNVLEIDDSDTQKQSVDEEALIKPSDES